MKSQWSALLAFTFLLVVASSQVTYTQTPTCLRPFSERYEEFNYTNANDLKARLTEFEAIFAKESTEALAYIYVYGGKKTRINEITDLVDNIQKTLKIDPKDYQSKIVVYDGGYRLLPTIEFLIKPLGCSEWPKAAPDLRADEVEFAEFPSQHTIRLQPSDIYNRLTEQPEAECPPAARAVRACIEGTEVEVIIIVDSKGNVGVSQTVTGHPLLRKAAEMWVKKWKFRPFINGTEILNFSGSILLQFHESKYELQTGN
jgi:hypothetical protein